MFLLVLTDFLVLFLYRLGVFVEYFVSGSSVYLTPVDLWVEGTPLYLLLPFQHLHPFRCIFFVLFGPECPFIKSYWFKDLLQGLWSVLVRSLVVMLEIGDGLSGLVQNSVTQNLADVLLQFLVV